VPYVGGTLAPLFAVEPVEATLMRMAYRGGERMVELTTENTPVDTGRLRNSWYQRRLRRARRGRLSGWESGVASDEDIAPHVEFGTGLWGPEHRKYLIVPKRAGGSLRWRDPRTGRIIFARSVMHPGSPGQHMVQIAAGALEIEVSDGLLFDQILREWVRVQESLV
jgi:Bacteriophage HK97-gp10, putative tail-component